MYGIGVRTSNNIYSIQTRVGEDGLVHVETAITKGLYRFCILGLTQKQASDARDRVYSALRASNVLNLKSDNRKITVNITPKTNPEHTEMYDLSIALSCLHAVGQISFDERTLVLGELSIGGDIVTSNRLLQVAFVALEQKISTIICAEDELIVLPFDVKNILFRNGVRFITGSNLSEVVANISNNTYNIFDDIDTTRFEVVPVYTQEQSKVSLERILSHEILYSMYIALCGGHDIGFEVSNSVFVQDFISLICTHDVTLNPYQLLHMASLTKEEDLVLLSNYKHLYTGYINQHTTRQDVCGTMTVDILQKSILGRLVIYNLTSLPQHIWSIVVRSSKGQMFAVCKPCPCGVESSFFTHKTQKCTCVQRSILRHQHHLQNTYKHIFTLWVKTNTPIPKITKEDIAILFSQVEQLRRLQFYRHMQNNREGVVYEEYVPLDYVNNSRDTNLIIQNLDLESSTLYESITSLYDQDTLHKILRLSQTLQDIAYVSGKEKSTAVSKQTVLLALSYIPKKDF